MPTAGYRSLEWLKSRLLPEDMSLENDHDVALAAIALGVCDAFDAFTSRRLIRAVGTTFETPADQSSFIVDLYPIESVTAQLVVDGSASALDILGTHEKSGIVMLGGSPGTASDIIRLTLTGGYYCADNDDALPAAATTLPAGILNAWIQQIRAICEAENLFRGRAASAPDKKNAAMIGIDTLALLPGVRSALQTHIRQG